MAVANTLESEIAALRVLLRQALEPAGDTDDLFEALRLSDLFGRTAMRIARLFRDKHKLEAGSLHFDFEQALAEATEELGIGKREP